MIQKDGLDKMEKNICKIWKQKKEESNTNNQQEMFTKALVLHLNKTISEVHLFHPLD